MTKDHRNDRRGPPRERTLPHPPRGESRTGPARREEPQAERARAERPRKDGPRREAPRREEGTHEGARRFGPRQEGPRRQDAPREDRPRQDRPRHPAPHRDDQRAERPRREHPRSEEPRREERRRDAPRPEAPRRPDARREESRREPAAPQREPQRVGRSDERRSGPGQVWLYGRHAVSAALANPDRRVFRVCAVGEAVERVRAEIVELRKGGRVIPEPETSDRTKLAMHLPQQAVHQGIATLVGALPEPQIEDVLARAGAASVIVVLDQVTDPHNVGAILRSAEAFGAAGVVVTDRHAPEETGPLAKSASGALERIPLVRVVNLARTLEQLKAEGFWCVGLDERGDKTLAAAALTGKVALVLGAEGEGLRRLTFERCDLVVKLPMKGEMPSLNVSNATAIALYELARSS